MPQRPHAHRVRDLASLSVEMVFAARGWATEAVVKDYGEDLLVQPCEGERLEDFRLWVQVKGVLQREQGEAWRVSVDHARRWARSREFVVFVVWDLNASSGKYCLPKYQVRDGELVLSGARSLSLRPDGDLDEQSLALLHWVAVFDHYDQLIVSRKLASVWSPLSASPAGLLTPSLRDRVSEVLYPAWELLRRLRIIDEKGVTETFRDEWRRVAQPEKVERAEEFRTIGIEPDLGVLILAVLSYCRSTTSVVPPLEIAHTLARLVGVMVANGQTPGLA